MANDQCNVLVTLPLVTNPDEQVIITIPFSKADINNSN